MDETSGVHSPQQLQTVDVRQGTIPPPARPHSHELRRLTAGGCHQSRRATQRSTQRHTHPAHCTAERSCPTTSGGLRRTVSCQPTHPCPPAHIHLDCCACGCVNCSCQAAGAAPPMVRVNGTAGEQSDLCARRPPAEAAQGGAHDRGLSAYARPTAQPPACVPVGLHRHRPPRPSNGMRRSRGACGSGSGSRCNACPHGRPCVPSPHAARPCSHCRPQKPLPAHDPVAPRMARRGAIGGGGGSDGDRAGSAPCGPSDVRVMWESCLHASMFLSTDSSSPVRCL